MKRAVDFTLDVWNSFFYGKCPELSLALFRSAFYLTAFLVPVFLKNTIVFSLSIEEIFIKKIFIFDLFHLPLSTRIPFTKMIMAWQMTLLFSAIGFFTRVSAVLSFLLGFYLLGIKQCFGLEFHTESTLVLGLLIMAFASYPKVFSFDGFLASRFKVQRVEKSRKDLYFWPIQLSRIFLVYIFFSAGLLKLQKSPLIWLKENVVLDLLVEARSNWEVFPLTKLVFDWIIGNPWICRALTLATLAVEVSFPLIFFSKTARNIYLPSAFFALLMFKFVFGFNFFMFMAPLFLAWIPWEDLSAKQLMLSKDGGWNKFISTVTTEME